MTVPENIAAALDSDTGAPALVMKQATALADKLGVTLYLVGGAIRDAYLGLPLKDLDFTVEGDPSLLADRLAEAVGGAVSMHSLFATHKLQVGNLTVDVAMARSETYAHPGALPAVFPASAGQDMWRRDFTINAMAVRLTPGPQVFLDPTGGLRDIQAGVLRFLHPASFQDDATRILRGVRYEQRHGFRFEPPTEAALRRDVGYLETISGDRIRREIELIFAEERAAAILVRAAELGVLRVVYPALPDAPTLEARLQQAARHSRSLTAEAYWAALAYGMAGADIAGLVARVNAPREWRVTAEATPAAQSAVARLRDDMPPSEAYRLLHDLDASALWMASVLSGNGVALRQVHRYLDEWRGLRPLLNGDDLLRLGVPRGPRMGQALDALRDARLDGLVRTREEEEALAAAFVSIL